MFDWRENLELAQTLGTGTLGGAITVQVSEATERCAVGRAYYAAFCHARSYASLYLGFVVSGGAGDHGRLAAHFRRHRYTTVDSSLNLLRQWRNQCDYDDAVPNLAVKVRDALREAAAVINRL